jgi:hypothetical protein
VVCLVYTYIGLFGVFTNEFYVYLYDSWYMVCSLKYIGKMEVEFNNIKICASVIILLYGYIHHLKVKHTVGSKDSKLL